MKKDEVYDYLAQVYLDKKGKKDKHKKRRLVWRYLFFLIPGGLILFLAVFFFSNYSVKLFNPVNYSLFLASGDEFIKINYNFTNSSLKKEGYTLTLSGLDAAPYQILCFHARRLKKHGLANLRIEIENKSKEIGYVYLSIIPHLWTEYYVKLNDFKGISYWNDISRISFFIEEWNTKNKDDVIYIDNLRFAKQSDRN